MGAACQGELKLLNTNAGGVTQDMAVAEDLSDNTSDSVISFLQVNKDMEQPLLGCTSPVRACHGTTMPVGVLKLVPNGPTDMAALMANYEESKKRVDMANPAKSIFLTKPLATATDVPHQGGKTYFANDQDPVYKRWLNWAKCGAKLEEVMVSSCPGGT